MTGMFVQVIEDFARSVGVSRYSGEGQALLSLELERSGQFCIEAAGEDVLVYLLRDYGREATGHARRALAICHHRHRHAWPLRVARVPQDRLLFCFRMPLVRASVSELMESLRRLNELHDRLGEEGAR